MTMKAVKNKPLSFFLSTNKIHRKRKGLEAMKNKILCTIKSTIYSAGFEGSFLNGRVLSRLHCHWRRLHLSC